ncbi:hypothetical protein Tco_0109369 [Tanacetum coccineum]
MSENNIAGNSMKTSRFWDAVIMYFEKETSSTRGYDSIVSKWKNKVRPRIGAFCVIIYNVEVNHESGINDLDVYHKVCAEYKMIYKQDFTLEHCYNILKDHQGKRSEEKQSYIELKNQELSIREAEVREAAQLKRVKLEIQHRTLELAERDKRDKDILFYNSRNQLVFARNTTTEAARDETGNQGAI